jgi:hypothetical protein
MNTAYDEGFKLGLLRKEDSDMDVRWDFADASKRGVFTEYKRGFDDAFGGKERQP